MSENYRIESRVIRNRRVNLNIELPERTVDTRFSYVPEQSEVELLNELHDYIDFLLSKLDDKKQKALVLEYSRILLHKAFSSPHSLDTLLKDRQNLLQSPFTYQESPSTHVLLTPATPRQETKRISDLLMRIPVIPGENERLENLLWLCGNWREQTDKVLGSFTTGKGLTNLGHRLVQILRAIQNQLQRHPPFQNRCFFYVVRNIIGFTALSETY